MKEALALLTAALSEETAKSSPSLAEDLSLAKLFLQGKGKGCGWVAFGPRTFSTETPKSARLTQASSALPWPQNLQLRSTLQRVFAPFTRNSMHMWNFATTLGEYASSILGFPAAPTRAMSFVVVWDVCTIQRLRRRTAQ